MPEDQPSTPVFSFSVISKSSNIVSDPVVTISSTTHSQFLTVTPFPTGKIKYYNDCASFTEVFCITVPVSIQSDSFNGKLDVLLNDSAIISFTITGGFPIIEPHHINWSFRRHGNDTFIPIATNTLSEDRLSLVIVRVQTVDSGVYKISTINEAGTVESTTLLHVIG